MDLEKIFKNLIFIDVAIIVMMFIAVINEPAHITALGETVDQGIYETEAGLIFTLIHFIAYLVNLILLYKYVSFAKPLYLILFVVAILLSLMGGITVSDPFSATLIWVGGSVSGAMLILLYYSPIKTKFEK